MQKEKADLEAIISQCKEKEQNSTNGPKERRRRSSRTCRKPLEVPDGLSQEDPDVYDPKDDDIVPYQIPANAQV